MLGAIWWANDERGFPVAFLLVIVLLVFWTWVAERTTFGRHVYAVGGNAEAARRAGINVRRIRIQVFMISGAMAGLGGVIFASRLSSVDLNAGGGTILLDAIAAAVIGGTSLFGGRGRVISALMGSLVIATVANGIDLLGYSSAIKYMVTGAILLAAVTLDTVSRRRLERAGRKPCGRASASGPSAPWSRASSRAGTSPSTWARRRPRRCARAVAGLGDLIDDYEFHYPQELSEDNIDEVRAALDGHGIYAICDRPAPDPRFGKGGLSSPDDARAGGGAGGGPARRPTSPARWARSMILWPGVEGYNYPFQTPYAEAWARFVDGDRRGGRVCAAAGVRLFLEHKNSEPAMKILMRNIGMTLHVIHKLRERGITNVQVNMDWQHLIMNGESLGEYAAMLAAEGLLGHQHANSGWGTFDDDNMVGATAFMETLELALELRRAEYGENGERLGFDLYPYTEDAVAAVARSVKQWRFIWDVSGRIDDTALHEAQSRKDAVRAYELVYAALGAQ